MKKQGKAKIISIEQNEKLEQSNEELNLNRARLTFRYGGETDVNDDDVMNLLQSLDTRNNEYSVLIELGENSLEEIQTKLVGKIAMFTTYTLDVATALKGTKAEGKFTTINNGVRTYTSFSESYIGTATDDETAIRRIKDRMLTGIADETYQLGEIEIKTETKKASIIQHVSVWNYLIPHTICFFSFVCNELNRLIYSFL